MGNTILMLGTPAGWYGNSLEVNGNGSVTIVENYVSIISFTILFILCPTFRYMDLTLEA